MVQRTKVAEVSASSVGEGSDAGSDSDSGDTPLQQSNRANVALKEQGQHSSQSGAKPTTSRGGSIKDISRKDSREERDEGKREEYRKENDYRRDEPPREQRNFMGRRAKENRERRFGDRDSWRRGDRRDRDGPREGPRTAVAK